MKNLDIRVRVSDSGLKYADVAEEMHISRVWLSTLLRYDLSSKNWQRIMGAIEALEQKKGVSK